MPLKQVLFYICIIIAFIVPVSALDSPPIMKTFITSSSANDANFFEQVSNLLMPHSGRSIPKEPDITNILVFALVGSSYNVEDRQTAQDFLSFLFYTGKAAEAYQQYLNAGEGLQPTNLDKLYGLAQQYYLAAESVFEKSQGFSTYLPEFVMFSLPARGKPEPSETFTQPTALPPSDPSKPYDDEEFRALADEWFSAYLLAETDAGYIEGDPFGPDSVIRILRGDGPPQAQYLYLLALKMNFSPEIHAHVSELASFFYAISQAGNEFTAFENEKVLPTTITRGRPEYDRAAGWYKAAQAALERSGLTKQGVKLPVFIGFDTALRLPLGVNPQFYDLLTSRSMRNDAKWAGI